MLPRARAILLHRAIVPRVSVLPLLAVPLAAMIVLTLTLTVALAVVALAVLRGPMMVRAMGGGGGGGRVVMVVVA